jgi:hypothetical protein
MEDWATDGCVPTIAASMTAPTTAIDPCLRD